MCSLADYHASVLYGAWVKAARDPDELLGGIRELLRPRLVAPGTGRS